MMNKGKPIYPFTAIVGQEEMKLALILNLINPSLGGVLIRGEKGTAKSTAVRGLAALLPERKQVEHCAFSCDPHDPTHLCGQCLEKWKEQKQLSEKASKMRVIDLPVSATEDRVVGTLDMEEALKTGKKVFEPGILGLANRNILYVDEVNLLDDHVVDVLLDSAAMGVNTVEREGVSFSHPSRFTLVGTMNPEEGDLRPQLLDRFGMVVDVYGEEDIGQRVQVVKRRLAFEENGEEFCKEQEKEQVLLRNRIIQSKEQLKRVVFSDEMVSLAAKISLFLGVDGHRADIVMLKTACTLAAFDQRDQVTKEDIKRAAKFVLPHRMRKQPFETSQISLDIIEEIVDKNE